MSHIRGHIEEVSGSCGILIPFGETNGLYFVPPTNWKPKKKEEVGFLPLKVPVGLSQHIVIAYDLIQWDHHSTTGVDVTIKNKLQDATELLKQRESIK